MATLSERYVNFYTDFAFKKLFGTEANKELLISFLNAMFDGREVIRDLNYLNVEHLGHIVEDRKAVFDVYCETDTGDKILVEMQKASQDYFVDRSIYYSTFAIQEQAPKGYWDFQLKRVYAIGILDFCFDNDSPDYFHHEVKLLDIRTKKVFYDKLTYIYLEMPKFRKTEEELVTLFDKWLYAIKHLVSLMDRPAVLREAVFTRFFEQAEIARYTPEEQRGYRESQKEFWDIYSIMTTKYREGRSEGRAEGRAEGIEEGLEKGRTEGIAIGEERGRQEATLANARALKDNGVPLDVIARSLALTDEQMKELA